MKERNADLMVAILLTSLALIFILLPPFNKTFIRVLLSLPVLFFIPGYVFVAGLFPGKNGLDGVERALFSFGLSIAVVSLIGFALNFTDYGITLVPVISVLYVFILLVSGAAIVRRQRMPEEERFSVDFGEWIKAGRKMVASLLKSVGKQ